ncbi:uncharacterized protein LOC105220713 [Zeugodacus cucurbitae]|uniref:uncharacterized protein LOC105220713 n=1 Tax=Zeugodacus cucurbitae TaxID=28588 RepID=UPI0005967986|nr:uncharacterized protein LOC105220713 [Zeugodacus cucurbitae]
MSISLQESKAEGSSKSQCRRSSRRNPLIITQEDDSDIEMDTAKENKVPQTPKSNNNVERQFESPSVGRNNTLLQTPRRSSRKSIKPVQEYEDIVSCKRQLRSVSKVGDEINKDKEEEETNTEEQQPRWTPAKVGRVSRKRGRKNRKTVGDKNKSKLKNSSDNEDTNEVKEHLQNKVVIESEDENIKLAENINEIAEINVENGETSEDIAEVHIATIKEDEVEIQPLQIPDDENKSNLKNLSDNEDTTEVKEDVQNNVVTQSQDENIEEADNEITEINVEKTEKSEYIAEVQIETIKDDTFNSSDCIMINQADEEVEIHPLQLADDENKSEFKNSSDNEDTTEVKEHVQINEAIQSQDEKIKESDEINEITNNVEKCEKSEECKAEVEIVTINDDTFNASEEDEMQPLQFSDDEGSTSPPPKAPRIILTTDKGVDQSLNVTAPLSDGTTPKRYSKSAKRMPTPYRKNTDITEIEDDIDDKCEAKEPPITIEISKIEPKEAVLRSIRKRSFSVCIGGAEAEKRKNVTFYSPANTTTILEDLDVRMVQSVRKNPVLKPATTETFITQRRKRSLSFDEAMINKSKLRIQTPSKMGVTPQKNKPARTKLPNFAAIHQKHFEKMENLVDHVNRKAERAKVLTNSASKDRVASAQKTVKTYQASATTTNPEKSKAVKRLNLQPTVNLTFSGHSNTSMFKALETSHKDLHDSKLPIPRIGVCKPLATAETTTQKENREVKLPNPRLGIIKPHIISVGSNIKNKQITPAKNVFKPTIARHVARPAFNLSTALESHANNAKSANTTGVHMTSGAVTKTIAPNTNTTVVPTLTVDEKMASRRQRHMDMFKGRAASTRTTPGTAEKRFGQLIRGVRSNRRFELQMAHRKNMEH